MSTRRLPTWLRSLPSSDDCMWYQVSAELVETAATISGWRPRRASAGMTRPQRGGAKGLYLYIERDFMSDSQSWPRIAVVGAGAVGGYFGGRLAEAGAPVVLIGRKAFVDAVNAHGLIIEQAAGERAIKVEATADIGAVADAELVLFCVKSNDTVSSAREIAPLLAPKALMICLQNGVDNIERIRAATKIQ